MEERLQKLIAQAGVASRRHAEELILNGEVTVNGETVTTLGTKADPQRDHIKVGGKLINTKLESRELVYILVNKPKGFLSSASDPENRSLVTELVPESFGKLHPVGRLDYSTEGLIILTNDGEFTNFVTAARNKIPKVYEVRVKGVLGEKQLSMLRRGIQLDDGFRTAPADINLLHQTENNAWYEVTLIQGHNQQIRRMFDQVGHSVSRLRRVAIGDIREDGKMPLGAYRPLTAQEVKRLMTPARKPAPKPKPAAAATAPTKKLSPNLARARRPD